jgi:adenosylcobinamide-GDP ribazoletransferase
MNTIHAIIAAFSCFSRIPMPHIDWEKADLRYMMAAFPLVGVVIGTLLWLWGQLCATAGLGPLMYGAGIALIPLAISGGIHMDGFADTIDALSSHASAERKREILKDPHAGAFAIMGICGYLIATVALAAELDPVRTAAVAAIPVISRCLSGLATVSLRASSTQGMFATEQTGAATRVVQALLALILCGTAIALLCHSPLSGASMVLAAALVLWLVWRLARREFGGMSGDLAGFYLQAAELAMLACIVIAGKVG